MDSANNLARESSGSIKRVASTAFISPSLFRGWIVVFVYNAKVTFSQILLLSCILRVQAIFSTIKT